MVDELVDVAVVVDTEVDVETPVVVEVAVDVVVDAAGEERAIVAYAPPTTKKAINAAMPSVPPVFK